MPSPTGSGATADSVGRDRWAKKVEGKAGERDREDRLDQGTRLAVAMAPAADTVVAGDVTLSNAKGVAAFCDLGEATTSGRKPRLLGNGSTC